MSESIEVMVVTEDEFALLLSRVVRSGSSNVIKDSEKCLSTMCASQPSQVFLWCIKHLHFEGDCYPEHILMAQTLLRICRMSELTENNRKALLNVLLRLNARRIPVTNPVATQLCSAFASSLLLEESLNAGPGWVGSVCSSLVQIGPALTDESSWFCYITAALGFVAEVCRHPDLQRSYSRRVLSRGQLSNKCGGRHALVERVLCETSSIIHFISQVGDDDGQARELRLQCLLCCTKWLELVAPAFLGKQSNEDQSCVQASLNSLTLWIASGIGARTLDWTARCLQQHYTVLWDLSAFGEVYRASLELVEGLCRCVSSDTAKEIAPGASPILDSISGQMSATLLPSLRIFLKSVAAAAGSLGSGVAGDAAVRAVGMVATCAADLLARAGSDRGSPRWTEFLGELVETVEELSVALRLEQDKRRWLVVEAMQPVLGVLCERSLRGSEGEGCAVAAVLERVVLLAVRSSQYPCSTGTALDLQDQEDFEDFRSMVRDWLREVAISIPRVVSSLLVNAIGALDSYINHVSEGGHSSDASAPWPALEAWLHALSAVSKHVVRFLAEQDTPVNKGDFSVKTEVLHLLVALCRTECVACRPLCRMGVVLIAEFLPPLLRVATPRSGLVVDPVCALLLSHLHAEAPVTGSLRTTDAHFGVVAIGENQHCQQASWLPFRVKQDHIGAVSLLKVAAGCSVGLGSGETFLQLPAICSLLCSDMDYSGRVAAVALAVRKEGIGAVNAALLSLALTLLMELHGLRAERSTLSQKSARLVREAVVVSLFTGGQHNLAAFVVPVCTGIVAWLNSEHTDHRVSDVTNTMCDLMCIPEQATEARSAATSVSVLLARSCTLEELLTVVSDALATLRRVCELRLPHEVEEYVRFLNIGLLVLANCNFQSGLSIGLMEGLSCLLCECAQLPRLCGPQQHSLVVFAPVFAELSGFISHTLGRHDPQLLRQMILPAASHLVRSIGALVAVSSQLATASAQLAGLFCDLIRSISCAVVNDCVNGAHGSAASSLVTFLSDSLAATALVPCPLGRQKVLLPADTLLVVCTALCKCANAALDLRDVSFAWKAAFKALASVLGPLSVQSKSVPLDQGATTPPHLPFGTSPSTDCIHPPFTIDGFISATVMTASSLHASRTGYGLPELSALLMENQIAAVSADILARYMVGSASVRAESEGFPPELREPCVATMIKLVLCLGTDRSVGLLLSATWDSRRQQPICASLTDRQQWVHRLLHFAESGDWKRFKATMRMLAR